MDEQKLYTNSEKEEVISKVELYLYDLDKLLIGMSKEIVEGIKANSATSLKVYITIKSYNENIYTINGQAIVTDDYGKPIGRCLLLESPISSTIFCKNIQEDIKYELSNPDRYLSNIKIIAKKVLNTTTYNEGEKTFEVQANINLNSTSHNPKILVYGTLETIGYSYNSYISEIRLYNPKIIPSVKY